MSRGQKSVSLSPYQKRVVEAVAQFNGQSVSSVLSDAVKMKIDSIPFKDRERILNVTGK